ncbi:EamA family transporter RarD [Salinactinospora qingdaonensis]|uniref:EamA family transporter RarD n=1 Tax=Salinactinospora qingdaonensis TaxID=702744 RepID=A0ABP7G124_9ACTN
MSESNRGVLYGVSAYLLWGLFPLYLPLLSPSSSVEILAQRMVWSLATVGLILAVRRHWRWLLGVVRSPRRLTLLAGAALAISVNWGLFIYTVNSGHTLQAALAYFINPLVSVALGVLVFRERLRRAQWTAVGLGAFAVGVLTVSYGAPPWLSLGMAFSFATYGMLKKFVRLDGTESLMIETTVLFAPALGFLLWLESQGTATFGHVSLGHSLLLAGSGLLTAVPLLLFGLAAYRVPLSVVGLLQFITPTLQFLIGWLVFGEEMVLSRWIGFAVVWAALAVFAVDMVGAARAGAVRRSAERAQRATADAGRG